MRVLVTGHHGYIGSVLTPIVAAAGHEVVGLDTFYYRSCDFASTSEWQPSRRADVRDLRSRDLEGFDAIVHLAALSNDPLGDLNSTWTYDINGNATIALARAAKEAGVGRFIFASSCSMYGAAEDGALATEEAPLKPLTPYAESKVRAEEVLLTLGDEHFAPVSMRNATAYGVSPRLRLDIVLNNLVAWAHTTGEIHLQSDGTAWRPLVHIRDIADATVAFLDAPVRSISGEAYNIGSAEQNYRIRQLAEVVSLRYPDCAITFAKEAAADPRSYQVDFSKLTAVLPDFRCRWTAARGVAELADAYTRAGLSLGDFEGERFVRLRRLRRLLDEGSVGDGLRWSAGLSEVRSSGHADET